MKKRILLIFPFLFACSSSPPKEEARESETTPAAVSAPAEKEEVFKETFTAPPAQKIEPSLEDDLRAAIKSQNDVQIQKISEQILAKNRNDERALSSLGLVYYRKNQFERSHFYLKRALSVAQAQKDEKALHYVNLGLVEYARQEKSDAIRAFRKALELSPEDGTAAANLGAIYAKEKDYAKAVVVLEMAYRKGPKDLKTMNNYGVSLMATGQFEKANNIFDEALKLNGSSREVLMNKIILYVDHLARLKEGLEMIQKIKFIGVSSESREKLSDLENKAKLGLK